MNKKGVYITVSILTCLIAGLIGSIATQSSVNTWYVTLNKPSFNPPNWIFAPVWTILFIMMGVAAGMVWSKGFHHKWVKTAMYHFVFQLLLNMLWSLVFFGLNEIFGALLIIISLLTLLIPYILWVSFALILNLCIWKLN